MTAFAIAFALSSLAGLLWLAWVSPSGKALEESKEETAFRVRFDVGLWTILGGFLGARIVYVIVHWGYFAAHPLEIIQIWQGGLSWPGAAAGALLTLYLYSFATKRSFWNLADALAAPGALLATGLWIGCLLDRCAYGVGGQTGPLAIVNADVFGVVSARWPTQAVGAGISALILIAVFLLRDRLPRSGLLASTVLALLAVIMTVLSFTRGDPMGMLFGLRLDTLGSLVILAVALAGTALRIWRK
jgi:phosphatidylglycerol:prolipoprotein diacylglycerol transferase